MKKITFILICIIVSAVIFPGVPPSAFADPEIKDTLSASSETANSFEEPFLPPSELSEAKEKFYSNISRFFIVHLYPIFVLVLLVFSGISKKIFSMAKNTSKSYYMQLLLFVFLFLLAFTFLKLPFDFWRLQSEGKSDAFQTLRNAAVNGAGSWLSSSVIFSIISFPFLWLLRKSRFWWLWATAVGSILVFAMMTIQIHSTFSISDNLSVMPESLLKERLEVILKKAGREGLPIYVRETSEEERTGLPNGMGGGMPPRVILWDIEGADPEEVEFVFAHELSHYIYRHFLLMIPIGMIFLIIGLPGIGWLVKSIGRGCSKLTGFTGIADIPALSTWFLLFTIYFFISIPFQNMCGRAMEVQADYNGARLSGRPLGGAQVYTRQIRQSKIYPDPPFYLHIWDDPHPAFGPRVRYLKKLDAKFGKGKKRM